MSSLRAVETLERVDPDFQRLCEVLYGGRVDAETVWEDVFAKRAPELTEKQRRERTQARVGLASNYVGLAAGLTGTGAAVGAYREASGRKKTKSPGGYLRPVQRGDKVRQALARHVTPKRAAGAALGLQGANLVGDAVANRVLNRSAKGPERKTVKKIHAGPVEKGISDGVKRMVNGILQRTSGGARQTTMGTPDPNSDPLGYAMHNANAQNAARARATREQKWGDRAASAGRAAADPGGTTQRVGNWATATPGRTVGSALTVGATGGVMGNRRGRRKGQLATTDNYPAYPMIGYGKADAPDIKWEGTFSKFDEDKRLAFGWASVVEKDGLPVVDRQGDYIAPEDMETAAYVYVQKSRVGGEMHKRTDDDRPVHVSDLVESVVFTKEKIAKMGLPESTPIGWWVGFKIHDDNVWETVKKGGHTGFSIHGRGRRQETSVDELHKYHR